MKQLSAYTLFITLLFSFKVFSAQVVKVKNSSVLINTEGDQIKKGQLYYLVSDEGKKKGVVKIAKANAGKAIGALIKGRALTGWTLRLRPSKTRVSVKRSLPRVKTVKRKSSRKRRRARTYTDSKKLSFGFVMGYNSNSSDVKFLNSDGTLARPADSYTGTSYSYGLLLDYPLHQRFHLRAILGSHSFFTEDAKNTQCVDSNGASGAVCRIDLSYISLDAWLRYYFIDAKHKVWAGAGIKMLFSPGYNSTTALKESDLGSEFIPEVGAGIDFRVSDKLYVPIWGQFAFNPSTDTVEGSSMSFYFGLGYRL